MFKAGFMLEAQSGSERQVCQSLNKENMDQEKQEVARTAWQQQPSLNCMANEAVLFVCSLVDVFTSLSSSLVTIYYHWPVIIILKNCIVDFKLFFEI